MASILLLLTIALIITANQYYNIEAINTTQEARHVYILSNKSVNPRNKSWHSNRHYNFNETYNNPLMNNKQINYTDQMRNIELSVTNDSILRIKDVNRTDTNTKLITNELSINSMNVSLQSRNSTTSTNDVIKMNFIKEKTLNNDNEINNVSNANESNIPTNDVEYDAFSTENTIQDKINSNVKYKEIDFMIKEDVSKDIIGGSSSNLFSTQTSYKEIRNSKIKLNTSHQLYITDNSYSPDETSSLNTINKSYDTAQVNINFDKELSVTENSLRDQNNAFSTPKNTISEEMYLSITDQRYTSVKIDNQEDEYVSTLVSKVNDISDSVTIRNDYEQEITSKQNFTLSNENHVTNYEGKKSNNRLKEIEDIKNGLKKVKNNVELLFNNKTDIVELEDSKKLSEKYFEDLLPIKQSVAKEMTVYTPKVKQINLYENTSDISNKRKSENDLNLNSLKTQKKKIGKQETSLTAVDFKNAGSKDLNTDDIKSKEIVNDKLNNVGNDTFLENNEKRLQLEYARNIRDNEKNMTTKERTNDIETHTIDNTNKSITYNNKYDLKNISFNINGRIVKIYVANIENKIINATESIKGKSKNVSQINSGQPISSANINEFDLIMNGTSNKTFNLNNPVSFNISLQESEEQSLYSNKTEFNKMNKNFTDIARIDLKLERNKADQFVNLINTSLNDSDIKSKVNSYDIELKKHYLVNTVHPEINNSSLISSEDILDLDQSTKMGAMNVSTEFNEDAITVLQNLIESELDNIGHNNVDNSNVSKIIDKLMINKNVSIGMSNKLLISNNENNTDQNILFNEPEVVMENTNLRDANGTNWFNKYDTNTSSNISTASIHSNNLKIPANVSHTIKNKSHKPFQNNNLSDIVSHSEFILQKNNDTIRKNNNYEIDTTEIDDQNKQNVIISSKINMFSAKNSPTNKTFPVNTNIHIHPKLSLSNASDNDENRLVPVGYEAIANKKAELKFIASAGESVLHKTNKNAIYTDASNREYSSYEEHAITKKPFHVLNTEIQISTTQASLKLTTAYYKNKNFTIGKNIRSMNSRSINNGNQSHYSKYINHSKLYMDISEGITVKNVDQPISNTLFKFKNKDSLTPILNEKEIDLKNKEPIQIFYNMSKNIAMDGIITIDRLQNKDKISKNDKSLPLILKSTNDLKDKNINKKIISNFYNITTILNLNKNKSLITQFGYVKSKDTFENLSNDTRRNLTKLGTSSKATKPINANVAHSNIVPNPFVAGNVKDKDRLIGLIQSGMQLKPVVIKRSRSLLKREDQSDGVNDAAMSGIASTASSTATTFSSTLPTLREITSSALGYVNSLHENRRIDAAQEPRYEKTSRTSFNTIKTKPTQIQRTTERFTTYRPPSTSSPSPLSPTRKRGVVESILQSTREKPLEALELSAAAADNFKGGGVNLNFSNGVNVTRTHINTSRLESENCTNCSGSYLDDIVTTRKATDPNKIILGSSTSPLSYETETPSTSDIITTTSASIPLVNTTQTMFNVSPTTNYSLDNTAEYDTEPPDALFMTPNAGDNATFKLTEFPWPVKKEAIMEGDIILGGLMMVHEREDSYTCGPVMPQGGIQALEAMLYTLDRLNLGQKPLLPNISLGAHILDDCDKDTYGLEMAVDFIKDIISALSSR